MLVIDRRTLALLGSALDQADREGRLEDLIARLNALDELSPDTRAVVFDRDGDIDVVLFAREGIAWRPFAHGCIVSRVLRTSRADRVVAA
jgi:hypothetical protein